MTSGPLVVGLDGREGDLDVVALALVLRDALHVPIVLAHVVPPSPPGHDDRAAHSEGGALLARAAVEVGGELQTVLLDSGSRAGALAATAERVGASMLVLGAAELDQPIPEATADACHAHAPLTLAIPRRGYRRRPALRTIAVAYDGFPAAEATLETAVDCARATGAGLRLWSAASGAPAADGWVQRRLTGALETLPRELEVSALIIEGEPPSEALARAAGREDADLLLIGSRPLSPERSAADGAPLRAPQQPPAAVPRRLAG